MQNYKKLCPVIGKKVLFQNNKTHIDLAGRFGSVLTDNGFECSHYRECSLDSGLNCPLYRKAADSQN